MATTVRPAAAGKTTTSPGRLPAPARDRRPVLAALALLLVLAGALGSALIAYRSGDRIDVLVADRDIQPGEAFSAQDFSTARVAAESGRLVPAANTGAFEGSVATGYIPAETLIGPQSFTVESVVPSDAVEVGIVVNSQQRPAESVRVGDVVRLYIVPRSDAGGQGSAGTQVVEAVRVTEVDTDGGSTLMTVLMPEDDAPALVGPAATGQVSVARLAPDTEPVIDFDRE